MKETTMYFAVSGYISNRSASTSTRKVPRNPYVSVQHSRRIISLCDVRATIGFIMSEMHFLFRRKAARQGRPMHLPMRAAASVIDAREIVSIAPRNELTLRVVICMSRAAILCCCNEELWRGVDKTSTRVGQRLAMITIASSPRCISLRRVFALNVHACNIIFYFVWIGTD